MAGVAGVQACPSCGSTAVSSERRTLDPRTGKPTKLAWMEMVVPGLLAFCGVIVLLMAVVLLVAPTPDLQLGGWDFVLIGVSILVILNFVGRLPSYFGRGRNAGLLCWCKVCAHEWFVGGQPAAESSAVASTTTTDQRTAPAPAVAPGASLPMVEPAPAAATAIPVSAPTLGDSGIGRLMEALKAMPLPEGLRGWDQVISVELEDRPGLWYRWVIDGDRWLVLEGETTRATLRVVTTEAGLVSCWTTGSTAGFRLLGPNAVVTTQSPGTIHKFTTLMVRDMARYLRASAGPTLEEMYSAQMSGKYASPSDSVTRVLQTMVAVAIGAAILGFLACLITGASSLITGVVVAAVVMVLALFVTIRNERTNYRKYHRERIAVGSAAPAPVAPPAAAVPVVALAPAPAVAAPAWMPTHLVPAGGMAAWDSPDPSRPPVSQLSARLELTVEANSGAWAQVRAANGWRGWVEDRLLVRQR